MSDEKPLFDHDCPDCIFLGRCAKERPEEYHKGIEALRWQGIDLYFCPKQVGGPTVIARYGHNGPDYSSGMPFATPDGIEELYVAKLRAIERGYLVENVPLPERRYSPNETSTRRKKT